MAYDPDAAHPGDAFIPALAEFGLARVPGHHDERDPEWRREWFAWRDKVIVHRDGIHALCHANASARADIMKVCADDPAAWLTWFAWINEPRPIEGEPPIKPYVPFAFQVDLLQWFVERASSPRKLDGYVSKARGLGASWIFCAGALWGWLFREWGGLLLSRKEELVDSPMNIGSLFGKIDFLLRYLPRWMLPEGFDPNVHRGKNKLIYPRKHHVFLRGESTSAKSTRGDRATFIFSDEAAFMEDFKNLWNTQSLTTNHRFAVSTESLDEGRAWREAWRTAQQADPAAVKELDWQLNAYQDQAWYAEERARAVANNDLPGFEREVERNDRAGWGAWVYPMAADRPVRPDLAYDPSRMLLVGIDPGHADDTGIVWGHPCFSDGGQRGIEWLDSFEKNAMPVQYYAHLLTDVDPEPGDEIYGYAFSGREREVMAFFGSLPWNSDRVRVFMDPAGAAKHNGLSFEDLFMTKTLALRQRAQARDPKDGRTPRPIQTITGILKQHNAHRERRHATSALLMHSSFADTAGAHRIKDCLENRKFQKETEKTTSEPKPLHDAYSHVATACEYVSVGVHYGLGQPLPKKAGERKRNTLAPRRAA